MLALFPAKKGDGLRGVAHADEAVAEGGFLLVLVEIEAHKPAPEENGDDGADRGVNEQHADKPARYVPEHAQEDDERHDGVDDDEEEIQHAGGEELRVLGDALVGVVHAFRGADAEIRAVEKIALDEDLREPAPPGE